MFSFDQLNSIIGFGLNSTLLENKILLRWALGRELNLDQILIYNF